MELTTRLYKEEELIPRFNGIVPLNIKGCSSTTIVPQLYTVFIENNAFVLFVACMFPLEERLDILFKALTKAKL